MSDTNTFGLSIIADRYALAFMELAEKHDLFDKFNSDLALIKETINANKDLKDFLEHPLIQLNDKKDVIDRIFRESVSIYTLNLVKLLIDKNRTHIIALLTDHYKLLLNKKRNISTAQIITAVEIDEDTKNRVKEKLERVFSQTIEIETIIDKEIIAGMIVKVGDKIIDGSIKTKFENMKKQVI
ncbi:MAG: ATP synthase F1 subunit delta [bacterium]